MDKLFECFPCRLVVKNHTPEHFAVKGALLSQHFLSKVTEDFFKSNRTRFHRLSCQDVGADHSNAKFLQALAGGSLSRPRAACYGNL